MKNLIESSDLSLEEIDVLLDLADEIASNPKKYRNVCQHKVLATLFFEPSTRTRLSFESAMYELGGSVIGFAGSDATSIQKGESVLDTALTVENYADLLVIRHPQDGIVKDVSKVCSHPIINAGDGQKNHPTQMLTDMLTIRREHKRLSNLTIGICGDLKHGRAVHSLVESLSQYQGIELIGITMEGLGMPSEMIEMMRMNDNVSYCEVNAISDVIDKLDVLYMTRMQKERFQDADNLTEYDQRLRLDCTTLNTAKKDLVIMHPLPRNEELAVEVDSDPRAAYFRQVKNGKDVRKALLMQMLK